MNPWPGFCASSENRLMCNYISPQGIDVPVQCYNYPHGGCHTMGKSYSHARQLALNWLTYCRQCVNHDSSQVP